MSFNKEMLEKAKMAKSPEELIRLAKGNGFDLTEEEADTYFAHLNPKSGELEDDELDDVAGGNMCEVQYYEGRPILPNPRMTTCDYWEDKSTMSHIARGGLCWDCYHFANGSPCLCMCPERFNN